MESSREKRFIETIFNFSKNNDNSGLINRTVVLIL